MRRRPTVFTPVGAALFVALSNAPLTDLRAQEPGLVPPVLSEMEAVFSENKGMVDHTMNVYHYALDIRSEEVGDSLIVSAAAILHDIGIPKAREVHGSSAGPFQEQEGPPIAREILSRHNFQPAQIDHICGIIANHHSDADPDVVNTPEFKIVWDADWLVNFPNRHRGLSSGEKEAAIEEIFKTKRGKQLARQMFLERPGGLKEEPLNRTGGEREGPGSS